MRIAVSTQIKASKEKVWQAICDIDSAPEMLSGIESVEILEKPDNGLVGLKWNETRRMGTRSATETLWITAAEENESYCTRSESRGSVITAVLIIEEIDGMTELSMGVSAKPQSVGGKIMSLLVGWMVKGSVRNMLQTDLDDIKSYLEK